MVEIPAFCTSCGAVFGSGIVARNVRDLTLGDYRAGPCPRCGGWGEVPDGTFDVVEDTIRILSAPELTKQRLKELQKAVEAARASSKPEESLALLRDEAPELRGVLDFMLSSRGAALAGWLALLVAILTVLSAQRGEVSDDQIREMTGTIIEQTQEAAPPEEITHPEKRPSAQEQPAKKKHRPGHRRSEHRGE